MSAFMDEMEFEWSLELYVEMWQVVKVKGFQEEQTTLTA